MAPEQAAAALGSVLERALTVDGDLAARLARTGTTVRFAIRGSGHGVTLVLDGPSPSVGQGAEAAEAEVALTAASAQSLAAGELPIAPAVFAGIVGIEGSGRKFLEVDPILQGLIAQSRAEERPPGRPRPQSHGAVGQAGGRQAGAHDDAGGEPERPDPDLLAIRARGIAKSFGSHTVLESVDLDIPEGVIAVVLGPSGTGKSVLFQHIIGALAPDRGEVELRGASITGMRRSELMRLRRTIGVMFQDGALFSAMTVFDNLAFPLREHTDLSDGEVDEIVTSRLRDVGLQDAAGAFPRELSGGMRKRAGLARALVLDPSILLCDEPDSGLDPVRTALIGDLLTAQHARGGGVILVVTHDIALAEQIADHVSVLWQGRIVASGLAEDVFSSDDEFVRQFLDGRIDGPLEME